MSNKIRFNSAKLDDDNPTTALILSRLPRRPLLAPRDLADAYGYASSKPIIDAIQTGRLAASRSGRRYLIARTEAERYVRGTTYSPDQA